MSDVTTATPRDTATAPAVEAGPVTSMSRPEKPLTGWDRIGQPWAQESLGRSPLRWGLVTLASLALAWMTFSFPGGMTGDIASGGATTLAWALFLAAMPFVFVADAKVHRIPNRILLPLFAIVSVLLVGDIAFGPASWALALNALAAVAVVGIYALTIYFIAPERGYGWGDVKLTALAGLVLGTHSIWLAVVALIFAAPLLALVPMLIAAARSADGPRTGVPFGPFIIIAVVLVAFGQVDVAGWSPLI